MSRRGALGLALVAMVVYYAVAYCAHAFRHPELTDTERFLRTWEALTWG